MITIDHLPTLLPVESSTRFSTDLLPSLLALADVRMHASGPAHPAQVDAAPVWQRARELFEHKLAESRAS